MKTSKTKPKTAKKAKPSRGLFDRVQVRSYERRYPHTKPKKRKAR